jgi:hypothetical protein
VACQTEKREKKKKSSGRIGSDSDWNGGGLYGLGLAVIGVVGWAGVSVGFFFFFFPAFGCDVVVTSAWPPWFWVMLAAQARRLSMMLAAQARRISMMLDALAMWIRFAAVSFFFFLAFESLSPLSVLLSPLCCSFL